MEDKENEFEAITLSNVWLKTYVLDVIGKINENEIIAYNGSTTLTELLQLNNESILSLQLKAFDLMRSYLQQLLHNVSPSIDKNIVLKLTLILKQISKDEQKYVYTFIDDVSHTDRNVLTEDFRNALNNLSRAKADLLMELADKEILMPKKSVGKDDEIKGVDLDYE